MLRTIVTIAMKFLDALQTAFVGKDLSRVSTSNFISMEIVPFDSDSFERRF